MLTSASSKRPHDRDADRGGREPGRRDAAVAAQRFGRDAAGREQRRRCTTARRVPERADDRTAADARRAWPGSRRRRTHSRRRAHRARGASADRARPTSRCRPRPSRTRANTSASTSRPSWRSTATARDIDGCSRLAAARECATARVTTRRDDRRRPRSPTHTPRHDAPSRNATPVAAAPMTAPPLNSPWKRTSRPGSCDERVGRDDVHHDVDQPARRHARRERGHEQRRGAATPLRSDEQRRPRQRARALNATPAPRPVGDRAADRGDGGRGDDAGREQQAELGVGEAERALDVDRGDRPRAGEEPEHDERGGDRPQRRRGRRVDGRGSVTLDAATATILAAPTRRATGR